MKITVPSGTKITRVGLRSVRITAPPLFVYRHPSPTSTKRYRNRFAIGQFVEGTHAYGRFHGVVTAMTAPGPQQMVTVASAGTDFTPAWEYADRFKRANRFSRRNCNCADCYYHSTHKSVDAA